MMTMKPKQTRDAGLNLVLKHFGTQRALARWAGVTDAAVAKWPAVPIRFVGDLAKLMCTEFEAIRPDLFQSTDRAPPAIIGRKNSRVVG